MKQFSIEKLAQIIGASPENLRTGNFGGVSTDSRTIGAGECFFGLRGENFDGGEYLDQAFEKGARCAVVEKSIAAHKDRCLLRVADTIEALGVFAAEYRRMMNYKVVAVTGSAGKTTTRRIIHHVLSQHFECYQAPKNFNNHIGLPLTLLGADMDDEVVIAELGANHPGEIAELSVIAAPDIALVTNVYQAHLEGFGDIETIAAEKFSIGSGLRPDGVLIINGDNEHLARLNRSNLACARTFGCCEDCDYTAADVELNGDSSVFYLQGQKVKLPLPGRGNIENAVAAWAVCDQFGIGVDSFARAISRITAAPMRSEILQLGLVTVVNDCYNANPASMKNALDIAADLAKKKDAKLTFICGEMKELGPDGDRLHAELGESIAHAGVKLLLAVGPGAKPAVWRAEQIENGAIDCKYFPKVEPLCDRLQDLVSDSDIILVKGSRSVGLERAVEELKRIFSTSDKDCHKASNRRAEMFE